MLPIINMWVHFIAVMAWIGGALFVSFVLRPVIVRSEPSSQYVVFLKRIQVRFKTIRWASIVAILITGFLNLLYEGGTERLESFWGAILMIKVLLAAIAIGLTGISDFVLRPRFMDETSGYSSRVSKWFEDITLILSLLVLWIAIYLNQF